MRDGSRETLRSWHSGLFCALAAGTAFGQTAPLHSHEVPWKSDSGVITPARDGVAYSTTVFVPRASWVRLKFGTLTMPGAIEDGRGAFLKITSMRDGKSQVLNAPAAAQWMNTSAYFNGDAVTVELVARAGTGPARVVIRSVTVGDGGTAGADSICGLTDDRVLSSDPRSARHLPDGCSSWLFNDTNHMFITAGHCLVAGGDVQEFNVPLSTSGGAMVHPGPEDQYVVDPSSIQFSYIPANPLGQDFTYFACFPNSNTGLTAYQKQGQYFTIASSIPPASGQSLRITGYGTTGATVPATWYEVQKTHTGPFTQFAGTVAMYQVDTTGGNSGSAVENMANGTVIAIHTNAGCTVSGGANSGTAVNFSGLQTAIANPLTLCATGKGIITGPLFAVGDGANNFGTLNTGTGNFAKVSEAPPRMEGLAFNWNIERFYAVSNDANPAAPGKRLYTINPMTGEASQAAMITGAPDPINGLGYDPFSGTLYGVAQATGQLYTINTSTGVASALGPANPGTSIGGLEYSPRDHILYGIDDSGGQSKLVKWSNVAAAPTVVGPLGPGITDCNGLAVTDSGELWTIDAVTSQLLRVSPTTGAATVIGPTGGVFGASFGMASMLSRPTCYANCDESTTAPNLTANDFQCFLNAFAAGDAYANCDGSTAAPVLTANDFQCFLNAFAAGCS